MQGAQGMLVQNWPTVSSAAGEWKRTRSMVDIRKMDLHLIILVLNCVNLLSQVADLLSRTPKNKGTLYINDECRTMFPSKKVRD